MQEDHATERHWVICEGCGNALLQRKAGQRFCRKRCERHADRVVARRERNRVAVEVARAEILAARKPGLQLLLPEPPPLAAPPTLRRRFQLTRGRAKHSGITWELSVAEYIEIVNQPCAYCGIEGHSGLDQVQPRAGYTLGNVLPCCWFCNDVKGSVFTADEMRKLGPVLRSIYAGWPESRFSRHQETRRKKRIAE